MPEVGHLARNLVGLGLAYVMWDIVKQEHICLFGSQVYRVPAYPNAPGVVEGLFVERFVHGDRELPVADIDAVRRLADVGAGERVH